MAKNAAREETAGTHIAQLEADISSLLRRHKEMEARVRYSLLLYEVVVDYFYFFFFFC
jgi:hypothetical protein